jgi:hypothetical protein
MPSRNAELIPVPSSSSAAVKAALLWMLSGLVLLADARMASGCQICFSGLVVTPGQQLDAADQAVLAVPDGARFRVVVVVKGHVADGTITEPVARFDAAALANGKPILLLRNELAQQWSSLGSMDARYAGWLRRLAATGVGRVRAQPDWPKTTLTSSELTEAQWRERLALVVPYLEDSEPLAAEIAHDEVRRAPFGAMRSVKAQLDASALARWLDDPALAARRSTYTLLLGIAGGPGDAAQLEQRIEAAWRSRDATNLAAMLAADLELRGPSRVGFIEQSYFGDRDRTMPEIEAALLALSVHGGAGAVVPRARVIAAYRRFIRERKPMAGFVAQELADWGYWDATSDYAALLKSGVLKDSASHFAVVNYLQRSPQAVAKAALRSLANQPR